MAVELPPEITVEDQWPESIRYRLPRRPVGKLRWIGLAMVLLGLGIAAWLIAWIGATSFGWKLPVKGPWVVALVLAFSTWGGWLPLWYGLALLIGRREFLIAGGKLRAIERIGPCWASRAWLVQNVLSLQIKSVAQRPSETPEFLKGFDALVIFAWQSQRRVLAWGYPASWLEPLAAALALACQRALAHDEDRRDHLIPVLSDYRDPPVTSSPDFDDEVDDDSYSIAGEEPTASTTKAVMTPGDQAAFAAGVLHEPEHTGRVDPPRRPFPPPAGTLIKVEDFDGDVTIQVPPAGIWKGSAGLMFFSLFWNGILILLTAAMLSVWFGAAPNGRGPGEGAWMFALVLTLFWAVGIGTFLGALHMGCRRAALAIAGGTLMVLQTGPLGTKRREWNLAEVKAIRVGPSGMKVNHVPVRELQIWDCHGEKFGMLAGRTNDELYWLASLLAPALNAEPACPPPEDGEIPPVSRSI